MDAPIERLDETRGELAKTWLLRVVEQSSLDEIERLPTPRIARELPELIGEIARAAAADEALEARAVELIVTYGEDISGASRGDPILAHRASQLRDIDLKQLGRRCGWLLPKGVDQGVRRDHRVRVHQQRSEQGARLGSVQLDDPVRAGDLDGPKNPELHDPQGAFIPPLYPLRASSFRQRRELQREEGE